MQQEERSSLSDGIKIAIIGGGGLVLAAIASVLGKLYREKVAPLLGKLMKYKTYIMALKEKASEMGLEGDGDGAGEGGVAGGAGVDIDGIGELGPRIKIFVSNMQILNMMPVRSMTVVALSVFGLFMLAVDQIPRRAGVEAATTYQYAYSCSAVGRM